MCSQQDWHKNFTHQISLSLRRKEKKYLQYKWEKVPAMYYSPIPRSRALIHKVTWQQLHRWKWRERKIMGTHTIQ